MSQVEALHQNKTLLIGNFRPCGVQLSHDYVSYQQTTPARVPSAPSPGLYKLLHGLPHQHNDEPAHSSPCSQMSGDSITYESAESIVSGIASGASAAESALIEKYREPLVFVLSKRCGDRATAEDICQEALVVALQRLRQEPIHDPQRLPAFLHQITINLWINDVRKSERRQTYTNHDEIEDIPGHSEEQALQISRTQLQQLVRELIDSMPNARDRKILQKHYVHDLDKTEICAELGLSTRHFDRVISRARKRFGILFKESQQLHTLAQSR